MATGPVKPNIPDIEGIELVEGYENHDTNLKRYEGKRVVILGHGNSAFETANALANSASIQQAWGYTPESTALMWVPNFHDDGLVHGILLFLAAVGMSVGFLASVMYLVQARRLRAKANPVSGLKLLSLERLETMNRRAVNLAFRVRTAPPGSSSRCPAAPPRYGTVAAPPAARSSTSQSPSGSGVEK